LDFKRLCIFDHKKHPIKVGFLCPTFMGQFIIQAGVFLDMPLHFF